ncbi:ExbD/TolR family protein [Roseinatronobacter sp. NSM]|uniref:ExbD/TolR family protein n=1 Tax=Roseinatronobacter sp. NSM TaxID=3457785 RepID=UPI00403582AE
MDFAPPRRRPPRESVVPMINVVFLLLIFFLMSAQIAPPDPAAVTLPVSDTADTLLQDGGHMVWLAADGVLLTATSVGQDVWAELAAHPAPVTLHADAQLAATELARVLRRMGEQGVRDVTLVAVSGAR